MKAERILKKNGVAFALEPVPRQLSSDCGLSIKYTGDDYEAVSELLSSKFGDKLLAYKKDDDDFDKIL